jgi:hypothetical protein
VGSGKKGSQNRTFGSTGFEPTTDVGHETRCRDYPCRSRGEEAVTGTMLVQPDAKTGPHHHGELETVLHVVNGRIRMRWGDQLEFRRRRGRGKAKLSATVWRVSSIQCRSNYDERFEFAEVETKLTGRRSNRSISLAKSSKDRLPALTAMAIRWCVSSTRT